MHDPILPTRSRRRIADDNRAELEGWIDERTDELVANGIPREAARQHAREEFGDLDTARRYAERQDAAANRRIRVSLWVDDLASDLRIAARTLARSPAVTAVILLTFALGIGATTAVFSVVHALLLRALPYGNEASLVQLQPVENGVLKPTARLGAIALVRLREQTTSFTGIAAVEAGNSIVTGNGEPEQVPLGSITPNGFSVLQSRVAIGRTFSADDESGPESRVVVLFDSFWRRRFNGDSSILGKTIEISGVRNQVIGVMAPSFRLPTYELAELVLPRTLSGLLADPNNAQVRAFRLFARLKPGVSISAAQADVDRAMRALRSEFPRSFTGIESRLVPIRTAVAGEVRTRLLVLMGAATFVLLIACANVAGILLSRGVARRHELAVRVALGAGRPRLIRQFLAEGAVLATAGAMLGLAAAQLGVVALRRIAPATLPAGTRFSLEPWVLAFAIGVAIAGACASSLVPALGATRSIGVALRSEGGGGRSSASRANRRVRLGLVAGQLAVSFVLLVGAGLFLRTLQRLWNLDLGYATEHAATFRPRFARPKSKSELDVFYASLYAQLGALPGVIRVGGGNVPMSDQGTAAGLEIEGRPVGSGRLPDVRYAPASDDYFAALGIPILSGRVFTPADRDGAPGVAVISASLAKALWPNGGVIGARVRVEPTKPWITIVGIVGDVRMGGAGAPLPSIYTSQRQDYWPAASAIVVRAAGDPARLVAGIRQVVMRVDPAMVITGLRTLENFRQGTDAIAQRRLLMQLISVFALVALAVSAIGVYGVSTYATQARRREFGIRMALGASSQGVLWLALRDGAHVASIGALAGLPLAWIVASRLRQQFYAVDPFDPLTVGAVLITLLVVVLAAALVPARRATMIDPASTMRTE
jgi:putative ABC transport system permease protein